MNATTERTPDTPSPGARRWFWPGLVVVLLCGQLLMTGAAVLIATSDRTFAVEPDYYNKALHWDEHRAQLQHNADLGWRAELHVAPGATPSGLRRVVVNLADREGSPIDGASVRVTSFHHARAEDRTDTILSQEGEGAYSAGISLRRAGLWEFRVHVSCGDDTFTAIECRDLPASQGAR